jgi:hypothetical protein
MLRNLSIVFVLAVSMLMATAAAAAPAHGKRHAKGHAPRYWHGYGFLPGYRPPEQIEWERFWEWRRTHGPAFWYGGPQFYHGRWNGGGFGPCWTQTPIGPIWNCGK